MKATGICPKCGSKDIISDEGMMKRGERTIVPISSSRSMYISAYFCLQCGYMEEYIAESELKKPGFKEDLVERWMKRK